MEVFLEITQYGTKNLPCGCIYKHPSTSVADFINDSLVTIPDTIAKGNKTVIIMGDFNLLSYDNCSTSSEFCDIKVCQNLQQLILQPSPITLQSHFLTDKILTNNLQYRSTSGNPTCSISEHFPQFTNFTSSQTSSEVQTGASFSFNNPILITLTTFSTKQSRIF